MNAQITLDEVTVGRTYQNIRVNRSAYTTDDTPAITLEVWDEEYMFWEPLITATTNLSAYHLIPAEGCAWVRTDGQHAELLDALADADVIEATGRTVRFGFNGTAAEARMIGAFA